MKGTVPNVRRQSSLEFEAETCLITLGSPPQVKKQNAISEKAMKEASVNGRLLLIPAGGRQGLLGNTAALTGRVALAGPGPGKGLETGAQTPAGQAAAFLYHSHEVQVRRGGHTNKAEVR